MLSHLITRLAFLLFLINCCAADSNPCKWKSGNDFCWLLCRGGDFSNFINYVEEMWTERPQCHANGISLGLFSGTFPNSTVPANWFQANVKANYLEFGMSRVDDIEDNAFSADAFRTVEHLTITEMNLYDLKKGMFNGLDALQTLTFAEATHLRSVEMGILDTLNQTLKELRIESDMRVNWDLPIASFTGSKQTLNVELVKIHYTMKRLTNKSFISLTKVKYFDLSDCDIEYIEEGTFDPIIDTVSIIQLANNNVKILPARMFDSKPITYQYTVVMVGHHRDCLCNNVPINFFMWVKCSEEHFDEKCRSYLPRAPGAIYSIPASAAPTTSPQTSPPRNLYLDLKEQESGDVVVDYIGTTKKNSLLTLSAFDIVQQKPIPVENMNCTTGKSNEICSWTIQNLRSNTKYAFCAFEVSNPMAAMECFFYNTKVRTTTSLSLPTTSPLTDPPTSSSTQAPTSPLTESSTSPFTEPASLPIHICRVAEGTNSGELVIYVNETTNKDHVTLILDVTNEDIRGSHCIRSMVNCYKDQSNGSCSLTVENLQSNTKYTLCVADEDEDVLKLPPCINDRSLCVEYKTRKSYSQIWLQRATPFLVIFVLVSIVSVSLMVGFLALVCKN